MHVFWFLAGMLTTLAALALLSPWLRTTSHLAALTATPVRACVSAAVLVAAIAGLYEALDRPNENGLSPPPPGTAAAPPEAGSAALATTAFGAAAKTFGDATGALAGASPTPGVVPGAAATAAKAGSMDSAVANLEGRLAKGGGTPGDWELLAKSFEFLGRPADAAKARAHRLPDRPGAASGTSTAGSNAPTAGRSAPAVSVSGEVTLDASLSGKVAAGDTLFILAKSVDSPGAPVAVIRTRVGTWPLAFTLDDSQSMMPGRTLTSAGRVTVEARVSKKGQPLAAPGDLQGSSGPIDPAAHRPLEIRIDRVIG